MKCLPAFFLGSLAGAAIGAMLALLFAPYTGEEMRSRIGQEATAERQKIQAEYDKNMQLLQERLDAMQRDLTAKIEDGRRGEAEASA